MNLWIGFSDFFQLASRNIASEFRAHVHHFLSEYRRDAKLVSYGGEKGVRVVRSVKRSSAAARIA